MQALKPPARENNKSKQKKIKNVVTVIVAALPEACRRRPCSPRDRSGLPAVASDGSPIRPPRGGRRIHSAATTIAVVASAALAEAAAAVTRRWKKWEEEADREREEWEEEADREGGVGVGAKREMGGESGCGAI